MLPDSLTASTFAFGQVPGVFFWSVLARRVPLRYLLSAAAATMTVGAIGTGLTPSLDEIAAVHAHIRGILGGASAEGGVMRILYGGSVNPANAAEILGLEEVNGALVGGASLNADDFWTIARSCP